MFGKLLGKFAKTGEKKEPIYEVSFYRYISIDHSKVYDDHCSYWSDKPVFTGTRDECEKFIKIQLIDAATVLIDEKDFRIEFDDMLVSDDPDTQLDQIEGVIIVDLKSTKIDEHRRVYTSSRYTARPEGVYFF